MAKLISSDVLHTFCDSFERVKKSTEFFEIFMENFLESSDEVEALFDKLSAARIKTLLQSSIYWPMLACDGNQTSIERLIALGKFHREKGAKIEHYNLWLDSMMNAVEECDNRYNLEVDQAWREVMTFAISIMTGQPRANNPTTRNNYPRRKADLDEMYAEEE